MNTEPQLLRVAKARAYAFRSAPQVAKESIAQYFECELGMNIPPQQKVWVGSIPTRTLVAAVLPGALSETGARNWDEYHRGYTKESGDPRASAPKEEKHWPIILASRGDPEPILDGWHRFHRYVDMGMAKIPVVWISPETYTDHKRLMR